MNTKIKLLLTGLCTAVLLLMLWMQPLFAQEGNPPADDLYRIAKPGNPEGWIDLRDDVNIAPASVFTTYKKLLGLGDDDDMRLRSQHTDKVGMTHFTYDQYYRGYRVEGAEIIVHERNGRTQSLNGHSVKGMQLRTTPYFSEEAALQAALASMGSVKFLWEDEEAQQQLRNDEDDSTATWFPQGELVWCRSDGDAAFLPENFSLCWQFDVRITAESGESKRVAVDATNGNIVRKVSISFVCDGGTGNTTWYGNKSISTDKQTLGSKYLLRDDCTGSHDYKIYTKNKNNGGSTTEYKDADNSWTSSGDLDGVTTHWCLHRTLDYYADVQGRNSYNDKGHNVTAYNNGFGSFVSNSCWGCSGNAIDLGEGPTTSASDDWNSMEVVGHEFTHGVTQTSAGLDYEKQSGALNESFSDIFGTVIESWTGAGPFDWTIGEDFGSPIRNMQNPNALGDPDTYKGTNWISTIGCNPGSGNDQCGVHTNSGVQNFFFYLLCQGGSGVNDNGDSYSVSGIGIDDAADIAYGALTNYLTSSSKYNDAREAWIRASSDLFGSCSNQTIQTGQAWFAVGVGPALDYYDVNVCGSLVAIFNTKYNAINALTAADGCTTTILPAANSITFEAANSIVLKDGFTALEGSHFFAVIDPCNISYWQRAGSDASADNYDDDETAATDIHAGYELTVFPSPFTGTFEIRLKLMEDEAVECALYDVNGVLVRNIVPKQNINAGTFTFKADGLSLPAGIYLLHGSAGGEIISRKIIKVN